MAMNNLTNNGNGVNSIITILTITTTTITTAAEAAAAIIATRRRAPLTMPSLPTNSNSANETVIIATSTTTGAIPLSALANTTTFTTFNNDGHSATLPSSSSLSTMATNATMLTATTTTTTTTSNQQPSPSLSIPMTTSNTVVVVGSGGGSSSLAVNMSNGNLLNGAAGQINSSGNGVDLPLSHGPIVPTTTFVGVSQYQASYSTTGIGPPATLTSNLLGFMGGIGIASSQAAAAVAVAANNAGNAATGFHNNNNNNNNDNNNNMDNTSEDSNPVTIYRCRAPIASLDCMEEFSGRSISLGSNPALPLRPGSTPTPGLRYKNLGKSGLRVSNVGLGTWPVFSPGVSDDQAEAILKLAIESGINLFDISEAHSETEIGKILQRTGWKRTAYVITTKVYWSTKSEERGLSRKHIIECVKASLQRLQLQYIDIVIIHKADAMCPMEEIVRAMNYIIQQGWAMYWGTARWSQVEIMEAYTNCRQFNCITPIVEQSEYHMFCREKCELYLPEMYNKIGVGLMAWGPLSMALSDAQNGEKIFLPKGSFKTKSQSYSWTEDEINKNAALSPQGSWSKERLEEGRRHSDRLRDLAALAEKLGCTPTQLSIAWSLKHEPVQCLLLGATSAEQLHQSLQSLQLLPRLSTSVMLEVERILENKPVRPPMISTLALR
ncbi:voltage-gated potassium channel subunit beta-3-like isoform X2 [Glossina fuscipes]|uniref:Voltage-gated potassium channel subunit beta-3-like isoform X2 n=1 Tax=Glossina fuscipes TaxID=7396 RepID=A0A9C5YX61_9MUSC|nr:voltage-gated potassium channel subunit beta-3-like isoform X2 [Glossina fuscipes]